MTDSGNEHLVAEAWFEHLNWAMQRRVLEVAGSDDDMAHVLLYFPLPFREGRTWVYPIKGEVPDGQWTPAHLAAIRAHVVSGPRLKKEQKRAAWTDITLEEHERERAAPRPGGA